MENWFYKMPVEFVFNGKRPHLRTNLDKIFTKKCLRKPLFMLCTKHYLKKYPVFGPNKTLKESFFDFIKTAYVVLVKSLLKGIKSLFQ